MARRLRPITAGPLLSPFVRQTLGMLASSENAQDLIALTELIESGAVTPVIDRLRPC